MMILWYTDVIYLRGSVVGAWSVNLHRKRVGSIPAGEVIVNFFSTACPRRLEFGHVYDFRPKLRHIFLSEII